jgi:hypothetical protein
MGGAANTEPASKALAPKPSCATNSRRFDMVFFPMK